MGDRYTHIHITYIHTNIHTYSPNFAGRLTIRRVQTRVSRIPVLRHKADGREGLFIIHVPRV